MILTGENQSFQRKTCPSDTLFTTNVIWTGLGFFFFIPLHQTVRSRVFSDNYCNKSGLGSSVSIATGYGLDGPRIESRWGRDFPHLSRLALGPTHPPVQWVPGLSRGKERPERDADPSPHSSAVVMRG
jgi:hypothetical protein